MTGSIEQNEDLADVIGDALVEAERSGQLPHWGARVIARALANRYSQGPTALHQFAATGRVHLRELATELGAINESLPDGSIALHLIEVLGHYLVAQLEADAPAGKDEAGSIAEDTPPGTESERTNAPEASLAEKTSDQVTKGIEQHGDAFRAYLALPDVNREQPDLLQSFTDFYIGSFRSMVELIGELTDARACMDAVQRTAEQFGFEAYVTLDYHALGRMAREAWDIVPLEGKLHVFMR